MEKLLTCGLCKGIYKSPRYLPCTHAFCLGCLGRYIEGKKASSNATAFKSFPCPLCEQPAEPRGPSGPADRWAESFPSNSILDSVLDDLARADGVACDPCRENGDRARARGWCLQCMDGLCESCGKTHRGSRASRAHTVVPVEMMAEPADGVCGEHGKAETLFCEDCGVSACDSCLPRSHGSCSAPTPIKELAVQRRGDAARVLEELGRLSHAAGASVEARKEGLVDIRDGKRKEEAAVRALAAEVRGLLGGAEEGILSSVNDEYGKRESSASRCLYQLEKMRESVDETQLVLSSVLKYSSKANWFNDLSRAESKLAQLKMQLEDVEKEEEKNVRGGSPSLKVNRKLLKSLKNVLVNWKATAESSPSTQDRVVVHNFSAPRIIRQAGSQLTKLTSILLLPNDSLLALDKASNSIKLFSGSGDLMDMTSVKYGAVRKLLPYSDSSAIVTLFDENVSKVRFVQYYPYLSVYEGFSLEKKYDVINVDRLKQRLVCFVVEDEFYSSNSAETKISIFVFTENSKRCICSKIKDSLLMGLAATTCTDGETLVVTRTNGLVSITPCSDEYHFCHYPITSIYLGEGQNKLQKPSSVCVDGEGFIYILDRAVSRIYRLNKNRQLEFIWLTTVDGIDNPRDISINSNRDMAILGADNIIKIFKLPYIVKVY